MSASTPPPFRRILVANRGEIAVRIIRACRELGVEAVAVYSDADVSAAHVRLADAAVSIGPAPAAESYLRIDAVVDAALRTGSEAIHPGYGFLSEREAFAQAVEDAGLIFIGPRPALLASLGDKLAARRFATGAGVPVVPGLLEPARIDTPEQVEAILVEADRIGFPLLVKAAAGGGGRGMRRVESRDVLQESLIAAAREAASAFGDGSVYLEREVLPARHIEVQLLGDDRGSVVALGERDCSIQRRHQKLIEEAPAPGLTTAERRRIHEMAVKVATAAGLRNAATAEFLFDSDRSFWFLEVNTRLQVEHGVTEMVSGVDIVAEQLWIAAGYPLSQRVRTASVHAARPSSAAIEVRLSAEDPARQFAPTPGRVGRWVMPDGPGVRVDTAIEPGDRIPAEYDPLIAKLMVHAADRPAAIRRLRRALDELEVSGIQTTAPFDRYVVRHPSFLAGDVFTGWVAAHWDGPAERAKAVRAAQLAAGIVEIESVAPGSFAGGGTPTSSLAWRAAGRASAVDRWPR